MSKYSDLLAAIIRKDLHSFLRKSFSLINPGAELDLNWHIEAMCWHLMQCANGSIKRLIITLPPRHLKSESASVAFPAWLMGNNPQKRIICVSYNERLAHMLASKRRHIMSSQYFKQIFPTCRIRRGQNTQDQLGTTKEGYVMASSVGSGITGMGADIIIIDDPITPDAAMSEAERTATNDWFARVCQSRLNNPRDGVIIIVTQRVHAEDLVGFVSDKGDWVHLNLPVIAPDTTEIPTGSDRAYRWEKGELLHPDRWDHRSLENLRRAIGSSNFRAQYLQDPVPPDGVVFKHNWIRKYASANRPRRFDMIIDSWDPAYGSGRENSYSVCTTWGIIGNSYYLLDLLRGHWEMPDLVRNIAAQMDRWRSNTVLIERVGNAVTLMQTLGRHGIRTTPVSPQGDKLARAQLATIPFERGEVYFPEDAPWLAELTAELFAFPQARHDDQVDSVSQFLIWAANRRQTPVVETRVYGVGPGGTTMYHDDVGEESGRRLTYYQRTGLRDSWSG